MRLFKILAIVVLLTVGVVNAEVPPDPAAKALANAVETFSAVGPAQAPLHGIFEQLPPDQFGISSSAGRTYKDESGARFKVDLVTTKSDSGAYALLTRLRTGNEELRLGAAGTVGIVSPKRVVFYKGSNLVQVTVEPDSKATEEQLLKLARSFATRLSTADDDLPVLVKHLPNWQAAQPAASYAVTLDALKTIVPNQQAVFETISFEGDTQAVAANYGPSQLVIVEFSTPQLSVDNDQRIAGKIDELRKLGQPVPSAYRRVGNYSVFVFNAPDESTANALIDQVKYEQLVQWLGDNPYWYEKAVKEWAQTSANVVLTVLKSSGLSLLICVGLGSVIGVLLFRRRRALQRQAAVYSDAGGMVRLDLDEITSVTDPSRLLADRTPKN